MLLVATLIDQIMRIFSNSCWQFTDASSLRRARTGTAKIVQTHTHAVADDARCMFAQPREIPAHCSYHCTKRIHSGFSTTLYELTSYKTCDGKTFMPHRARSHNSEKREGSPCAVSSSPDDKVYTFSHTMPSYFEDKLPCI